MAKQKALTWADIEKEFKKSQPIVEDHLANCHVCKKKNVSYSFFNFMVTKPDSSKLLFSFCKEKCMSSQQRDFVVEKKINPELLNAEIMVSLEQNYFQGKIEPEEDSNEQEFN